MGLEMNFQNNLGEIISTRRKFLGLNQESLAEMAEVSLRSLKSIEVNTGNPGIKQLTKILDVLGLKIDINIKVRS